MAELIWDGKYKDGKKVAPVRIALPFQTIETVNETVQDRQKSLDMFSSGRIDDWKNRLIWGDKKYVLPSLLEEFAGKVSLIYIDPPFNTGSDFSFYAAVPNFKEEDDEIKFLKQPSIIEQKAYRDIWAVSDSEKLGGKTHLDKYLQWFNETVQTLYDLLKDDGSIYVHLDWHVGHYAKVLLDEIFGADNFRNEIIWYYYNKFQGNVNRFASNHDVILWYTKSDKYIFNKQKEKRDKTVKQIKRVWDKEKGSIVNAKDENGKVLYIETDEKTIDDVWRLSMLQPADKTENLFYPTQKPETILERIISASSNENDLVFDCFSGSGTTAATAEKLKRRWITCDLGRFAIHTTRKRLLSIETVNPFIVQNLGKYERQAWQSSEFSEPEKQMEKELKYRMFILNLYKAEPITGFTWLHGIKKDRMIYVGNVDSPVTLADVKAIAAETWKSVGKGKDSPKKAAVDILGWDFALEVNEISKQIAAESGVEVHFKVIPREVLEKKAVEQGDIKFFELASLAVDIKANGLEVTANLKDFVIPPNDVPADIQKEIKHYSQWVDYWAIDWDYKNDTFHNEWQSYRSRQNQDLELSTNHTYEAQGEYQVVVKVIDILGNDTTKLLKVKVSDDKKKK